jgi:hypothetical protein
MPEHDENRFILERHLARHGVRTAAQLRDELHLSPATLSRHVRAAQGRVVRLGRARAARYALPRAPAGLPSLLPVFRVPPDGRPQPVARLQLLATGGTWVETPAGGHLHEGLPPVLVDMAPAGYLGRSFPRQHAELRLPSRPADWSDDHRLVALARRGEDLPGDLVVGEESVERLIASEPRPCTLGDYPELAELSARGGAGPSAAGEFPKFAAFRDGVHRLVKFTPGDGSPTDLRWRDLLVCEALALEVLAEAGISASKAELIDVGARRHLDVVRFDRVGARGRRGVLTLAPLDDDLFGQRDSWSAAALRLQEARLLTPVDARRVRLLDAFGACIANGDRHFGNLAFFADGLQAAPKLALAPVYDMLPMNLAPNAGTVPPFAPGRPRPRAAWLDVWDEAVALSERFWRRVAGDPRVGADVRRDAARAAGP